MELESVTNSSAALHALAFGPFYACSFVIFDVEKGEVNVYHEVYQAV